MNVARLNFSLGDYQLFRQLIQLVRDASVQLNTSVDILQDLRGRNLRLAKIPQQGIKFDLGEKVIIAAQGDLTDLSVHSFDNKVLPLDCDSIEVDLQPNSNIVINGGQVIINIQDVDSFFIRGQVSRAGTAYSYADVKIPCVKIVGPIVTDKDIQDIDFGLEMGVDYIALPFVGQWQEIVNTRRMLAKHRDPRPMKILAKIQSLSDFLNRNDIIKTADGIIIDLVALDQEVPAARFGTVQQYLVANCLLLNKPYIVI